MSASKNTVWLYEGPPEQIALCVPDASPAQGGYVMVCELQNEELRMFATRFPTKCVANWNSRSDRFAGAKLRRVLISVPIIPYERAKKALIQQLAQDVDSKVDESSSNAIESVKKHANKIFMVRAIQTTNIAGFLQQ
ncbi:hypothetical protein [Acidovorax sp. sic0104]|uniref:hypothetical protein n=1 Tax=Acidovorax sp. sic0104 TaxID=2854784 RepID=UPI001C46256B|nr:hypothetical protein [Acidovorax sp. sic0104]MBV7542094.1 hypothetical protein [Acidovorax sp. sic0104]